MVRHILPRLVLASVVASATACVTSSSVECSGGLVCPAGTTCAGAFCATPAQRASCTGSTELAPCTVDGADGLCRSGACIELTCGDGLASGFEECDGTDLRGAVDCTSLDYYDASAVTCTKLCTYDVSACQRRCGDGVLDPEEVCDAEPDVTVASCTDAALGFYSPGSVTCTNACLYDLGNCSGRCGDGVLDPGEVCDGTAPEGTCLDYGYDAGTLSCSSFCSPGFAACKRIGWTRAVPVGLGQHAHGIWSPRASDLWVSTGFGITRVVSGVASSSPNGLGGGWGMWGVDGVAVYVAGGSDGGIARHANGAWSTVVPQSGSGLYGVSGTGPDDVWAVGDAGVILHYDGTWSPMNVDSGYYLRSVWARTADDAFAVGASTEYNSGNGNILRYDGQSWNIDATGVLPSLAAVWGSAADDVWAVGSSSMLLHRDAASWTSVGQLTPNGVQLQGVWGRARDDVHVVGSDTIARFDGDHWWDLEFGLTAAQFYGVGGNAEQTFAAGLDDLVLRNDGASWSFTSGTYEQVGFGSDGTLVAAGGSGVARRGVLAWNALAAPAGARRVWVGAVNFVVAGSPAGGVFRYDGSQWTTLPSGPRASAIWASAANDIWTVDANAAAHWNGSVWTTSTGAPGHLYASIAGTAGGDVYVAGAFSPTSLRKFAGGQWTDVTRPGTGPLADLWVASANDIWAVGDAGTILHFDGVSWTSMPSGTSARLTAVHGSGPDDVWAVGVGATILHYDGAAWTRVRAPATGNYLDVAVRDDLVVIVEGSGGTTIPRSLVVLVRSSDW